MDHASLSLIRQNYSSKCFKCNETNKNFVVYKCGKCIPQTVEKYCYECCEKSTESEPIAVLCMGCAFCYDYIKVTQFYNSQKEGKFVNI